jgi:hypothetical protein
VFKLADSIDHCSLTKYRIPFSFTLLDSSLKGASFVVKPSPRNSLSFQEKLVTCVTFALILLILCAADITFLLVLHVFCPRILLL